MSDALRVLYRVLSAATDAMVLVDPEERVVLLSRGAEELFGYRVDEVRGEPFGTLLVDATRPDAADTGRGSAPGPGGTRGLGEGGALQGRRKGGEAFSAEASISPLSIGEERFLLVVVRDPTEPGRAGSTRAPSASEPRTVSSEEKVPFPESVGVGAVDDDGTPLRRAGSGEDASEGHRAEEHERALRAEKGSRRVAEAAAERSRFLAEASAILASSLDVEETLRSLARFSVPRFADWCAVDLVGEGSRLRRVAVAHPDPETEQLAREAYDRYPPDPARPDPIAEMVRTGRPQLVREVAEELLEATAQDAEHLALLRRLAPRSAIGVPLVARGRTLGALSFIHSDSERRYGPEDLDTAVSLADRAALAVDNARLLGEAERAARAREEAVATVSHDLRNPLGLIHLNLELLREPSLPAGERERILERAERAVWSMRRLVADLLDVTRLEGGGVVLHREELDLRALFGDARELVGPAAAARGVRIECEAPLPGTTVRADRDRLLQVLGNLLDNAIRFSPEGGRVRLVAEATEQRLVFRVEDEGPGIPPELGERVFERFWQGGGRRRHGAGLGLAIARNLVALHGGTLWIGRTGERGTTLCFTLGAEDRTSE